MKQKYERAEKYLVQNDIATQPVTFISKGERLAVVESFIKQLDPNITAITRQRMVSERLGTVIKTKDAVAFLSDPTFDCSWIVAPLNQVIEWAWSEGYRDYQQLKNDFAVMPLGGGECSIELACDPDRQDIINQVKDGGSTALNNYLLQTGELIFTDTPGIAGYFFDTAVLRSLSGSLEAFPKSKVPVIAGIVESGNSLIEESWLRLSEVTPKAVLLKSQLVVLAKKKSEQSATELLTKPKTERILPNGFMGEGKGAPEFKRRPKV